VSRLVDDLRTVAAFTAEEGRITRLAWTPVHLAACRWLIAQLEELGIPASLDPAGNVIGRWGEGPAPALLVGSHIDSVPDAGAFDGVLGVLAGLEALRRLKEDGFTPGRPVWLAAFMDEEGSRFGATLFGSRAFAGEDVRPMLDLADDDGTSIRAAMTQAGFAPECIGQARAIDHIGSYVELHIEQGPVLEAASAEIGVVSAISGGAGLMVGMSGVAGHAGTTPMEMRHDALVGAARAILALRDEARAATDGLRITVGRIAVEPGGTNVIPGGARFTIDIRSFDQAALEDARSRVESLLRRIADSEGLGLTIEPMMEIAPLRLDDSIRDVIAQAARAEHASTLDLPSGAGHDALVLGRTVPTAMIFVPSRAGISHSPQEHTDPEHCELGARVLTRTIRELAAA
jgi:allantoate deiminase